MQTLPFFLPNLAQKPLYLVRTVLKGKGVDTAVSRIPTAQIKHPLQKSKEVVIKVPKHIRKVVSQSSKLHIHLWLMPGGGTLVISGWGCAAGTLEPLAYTRASSAKFCYPIL